MDLEIHYDPSGWAALYVNGRLDVDTVGDSYHAEERAFELLGVKQVQDNSFMRGHNDREHIADTLDEVAEYRRERDNARELATQMRAEAERLIAEAKELEK